MSVEMKKADAIGVILILMMLMAFTLTIMDSCQDHIKRMERIKQEAK